MLQSWLCDFMLSPLSCFLLCDRICHFWDLFHISKFPDLASGHSLSLFPKLLSQSQKIDFAPCANSGGLVLAACNILCSERFRDSILSCWEEVLNWSAMSLISIRLENSDVYKILANTMFDWSHWCLCGPVQKLSYQQCSLPRLWCKSRSVMDSPSHVRVYILPGSGFYISHVICTIILCDQRKRTCYQLNCDTVVNIILVIIFGDVKI